MTTRLKGFTVVLNNDIREDDAEQIIRAIQMIKGVQNVVPVETNPDDYINRSQIRHELYNKILKVLDE